MKKKSKTKKYQVLLGEELKDPELSAEYLSESLKGESVDEFLLALRNVADAHGGISIISEMTNLNRQSMYKTLSKDGNPTLGTLLVILKAVGINLSFEARKDAA
jgi:probable addiction module antidote protein